MMGPRPLLHATGSGASAPLSQKYGSRFTLPSAAFWRYSLLSFCDGEGHEPADPKTAGYRASARRRLEIAAAFAFGCIAIGIVLWLAFRAPTLSDQQFEILRIVLALAGGGVGAVVPGFLDVTVTASTKLALRAGGALAVFVILYFWSPAHWAAFEARWDSDPAYRRNQLSRPERQRKHSHHQP